MTGKIASLSLSLLLAGALAVMAQSPTSSAPPGAGATHDPYGATLDHPNPNSGTAAGSAMTTTTTPAAPAMQNTTPTPAPAPAPATTSTDTTTTTTTDTSNTASTGTTTPTSLPRTGSELPLFAAMGFLALASALTLRSFSRQRGR